MRKGLLILAILLSLMVSHRAEAQFSLWLTEKRVSLAYDVPEVDYGTLSSILSSEEAKDYLLFDTRTKEEFEVSHLAGALRVDPDMDPEAFMSRYGNRLRGKHLVFYCSVGERSSAFAERVKARARKVGASSVSNLRGGIFRWYNEGLPVVNGQGETDAIHPFDAHWGRLLRPRSKGRP